jgi:hypothetical protein
MTVKQEFREYNIEKLNQSYEENKLIPAKSKVPCSYCKTEYTKNRITSCFCSKTCRFSFHNYTKDNRYLRMLKYKDK